MITAPGATWLDRQNIARTPVALSEGGTGWIPYFLDRLDRTYEMHHLWTGQNFGNQLPSEVFRDHFLTCFIADPVGLRLRDEIGVANMCWEMDYPHSDSSWPQAPEEFVSMCAKYGVPDDEMRAISHENAMRWYGFDPFTIRPKEQSTVGHLRQGVHSARVAMMDTCPTWESWPGRPRPEPYPSKRIVRWLRVHGFAGPACGGTQVGRSVTRRMTS